MLRGRLQAITGRTSGVDDIWRFSEQEWLIYRFGRWLVIMKGERPIHFGYLRNPGVFALSQPAGGSFAIMKGDDIDAEGELRLFGAGDAWT